MGGNPTNSMWIVVCCKQMNNCLYSGISQVLLAAKEPENFIKPLSVPYQFADFRIDFRPQYLSKMLSQLRIVFGEDYKG